MQSVSIIVPTLNEAGNIAELLSRISALDLSKASHLEVIIVDDGSTDGTCDQVKKSSYGLSVRILSRMEKRGLASAIIDGAAVATGDIAVVMDADLSHPPEAIPELVASVADGICDMAIGSRYVSGGATPGWALARRMASRLATVLAWPISDVKDPMSGFFAVRRTHLVRLRNGVSGFKIGLALLADGGESLRTREVPIVFHDRCRGKSKFGPRVILEYLHQLIVLAGGNVSAANGLRFILVGLLGVVTDLVVFQVLFSNGLPLAGAHTASFFTATIVNYILNSRWAFTTGGTASHSFSSRQYLSFMVVAILAVFMRGGVLASLTGYGGWPVQAAILGAIVAAAGVNYIGCAFFVFSPQGDDRPADLRWRVIAMAVIGYTLFLRLVYLGVPELLHEEAYYWNYAQHLDIGYLDHPPAVAWIIRLGTIFFGDTEFGVRIGAYVCWLATAFFSYKLARKIFSKSTAIRALLLVATLPIFFGVGFVMTPDAPLIACWSGMLYFLYRALVDERRYAWLGAGLCLGLGMLSKYTIALLVPATFVFMLVDKRSGRWLLRPEPYLGGILALILFSPVIIWNFHHEWASFIFQGSRRVLGGFDFSLHELIGSILVLITPTGFLAAMLAVFFSKYPLAYPGRLNNLKRQGHTFAVVFLLVPLSVFFVFSLCRIVKLNWTGPLWLAVVPFMAHYMIATLKNERARRLFGIAQRVWPATIAGFILIYGASLHYLALGLPGLPYPDNFSLVGCRDLGQQIEQIEKNIETMTGETPLVVGMDKYRTASLLAFYLPRGRTAVNESPLNDRNLDITGCHLFGGNSLMYRYWFPEDAAHRRDMILVSPKRRQLNRPSVRSRVRESGDIQELVVRKNGKPVGNYYYVVVKGYKKDREAIDAPVLSTIEHPFDTDQENT